MRSGGQELGDGGEEVVDDGVERVQAGLAGLADEPAGGGEGARRRRRSGRGRRGGARSTRRCRRRSRGGSRARRRRGCPATSRTGPAVAADPSSLGRRPARIGGHDPAGERPGGARRAVRLAAPVPLDDRRLERAGAGVPAGRGLGEPQEQRGAERQVRRDDRGGTVLEEAARGPGRRRASQPGRRRGRTPGCPPPARARRWRRPRADAEASTTTSARSGASAGGRRGRVGRPAPASGQPAAAAAAAIGAAQPAGAVDQELHLRSSFRGEPRVPAGPRITKAAAPRWCPRPLGASGPGGSVVRRSRAVRAPGPEPPGRAARASSSSRSRRACATWLAESARCRRARATIFRWTRADDRSLVLAIADGPWGPVRIAAGPQGVVARRDARRPPTAFAADLDRRRLGVGRADRSTPPPGPARTARRQARDARRGVPRGPSRSPSTTLPIDLARPLGVGPAGARGRALDPAGRGRQLRRGRPAHRAHRRGARGRRRRRRATPSACSSRATGSSPATGRWAATAWRRGAGARRRSTSSARCSRSRACTSADRAVSAATTPPRANSAVTLAARPGQSSAEHEAGSGRMEADVSKQHRDQATAIVGRGSAGHRRGHRRRPTSTTTSRAIATTAARTPGDGCAPRRPEARRGPPGDPERRGGRQGRRGPPVPHAVPTTEGEFSPKGPGRTRTGIADPALRHLQRRPPRRRPARGVGRLAVSVRWRCRPSPPGAPSSRTA